MSPRFEAAFKALLEEEGGYVFHPSDPGGETKYGITKRSYPELDIKNLTVDVAKAIYHRDFWDARYDELPEPVVEVLFEFGVNAGRGRAVAALQRAINAMPLVVAMPLRVDGALGPMTNARVWTVVDKFGTVGAFWLADKLRLQQASYYTELAAGNRKFLAFLVGWLRRAIR